MTTTSSESRVDLTSGVWYVSDRVDTRHYDANCKPIPGSGVIYECDCCGKAHEVWVYIYSKSNETAIVGTSCAKKCSSLYNKHLLGANYTMTRRNGSSWFNETMKRIEARH